MGKQKRPIISKGDMHPHGRRLGQRLLLGRCETHVRNSSWFTSCFHPHGRLLSPHFEDGETEAQRANNVTSLRLGFLICQMGITMVPASLGWCENEMSQCTQSINSVVNNCNSRCDTSVCGYYSHIVPECNPPPGPYSHVPQGAVVIDSVAFIPVRYYPFTYLHTHLLGLPRDHVCHEGRDHVCFVS